MTAIASLFVVLTLSFLITRLATLALTLTGLSRDLARLQSVSAFTGVGYAVADLMPWAMVGEGKAYTARGIPLVGPKNRMPSEGFGTLSLKALWRDVAHGFLGLILRQFRFARSIRGHYDLVLATGDIIPLMAGRVARTPICFVSCAKSADASNCCKRA